MMTLDMDPNKVTKDPEEEEEEEEEVANDIPNAKIMAKKNREKFAINKSYSIEVNSYMININMFICLYA